jgi:ABC-type iron transport system FetAB permease component
LYSEKHLVELALTLGAFPKMAAKQIVDNAIVDFVFYT